MSHILNIVMLAMMVPTILILFFYEYPKKWRERKYIYGILNRAEYKEETTASRIDEIITTCRKQAKIILICSFVIMLAICVIPDFVMNMITWSVFIILDIILINIPLFKGNSEMKSLKRELGITSKKGVSYTDLKSAGAVHSLKLVKIIVPNIIAAVFFLASLLSSLGVVNLHGILGGQEVYRTNMMTGMSGAFLLVGLMLIPIAVMMDNIRNEVISDDSDINMNYNRAKKKNMADFSVLFTWINTICIIIMMVVMSICDMDILYMVICGVYMLALMAGLVVFCKRNVAIERRYKKETTIEIDDDDNWLLGQFYYNPDDKRLNVEKRVGVGTTINIAHPVGKIVGTVSVLLIIYVFIMLIYIGILSKTPMSLRIDNASLICSQMKTDYSIPISDMSEPELRTSSEDLKLHKLNGYDMEPLYKGKFTVDDQSNCIIFLNLEAEDYIYFSYNGQTYYLSCDTSEETQKIYDELHTAWENQ